MSDVKVVKVRPGFWTGWFEEGTWDELDAETTVRALLISGLPLPEWIPEVGEKVEWHDGWLTDMRVVIVVGTPFYSSVVKPVGWCVQVARDGIAHVAEMEMLRPITQPETVTVPLPKVLEAVESMRYAQMGSRCWSDVLADKIRAIVEVDDES